MTAPQSQDSQWLSDISSGMTVLSGLKQGGAKGYGSAVLGATQIGAKVGGFGTASTPLGEFGNALNIYSGIERGGVLGYGNAAVNSAELGAKLGAFGGASGSVLDYAGYAGAALSVYNFAENWQSGQTGGDALRGAEAGAAIGSVIPGVGTIVGAVVGGAIGALSSAFGQGATDPETHNWQGFINATGGANATQAHVDAATKNLPPAAAFNLLTGVMDIKDGRIPFVNAFGNMGETNVLNSMTAEINSAIKAGKIAGNATPQQIFSQVVTPWLNSKGATISPETGGLQLQAVLTSLIGSWQNGTLTSKTPLDSGGQTDTTLPPFAAGHGAPTTPAQKAATTARAAGSSAITSQLTPSVQTFGTSQQPGTSMAATLAIPGAAAATAGVISMADPNNPNATNPTTGQPGVGGTGDPTSGGGTSSDPSFLSSLASGVGSFLSSPLGSVAEFGTLAGLGLSQANAQKTENDQLASSLATPGQPYTAAGSAELSQLEGGPQVGGPLGASITQQTTAASELGKVATEYGTGNLTAAQNTQVQQYVSQQQAVAKQELAAAGVTDPNSQEWQTRMQQIDDNAAVLTQQLTNNNVQMAQGALTEVQQTYSNLLNQALSSSEFGFSTEQAAVQTQIQSDTALAGQLQQLFSGIAQGFGNAMGGGSKGGGGGTAGAVGSAVGSAVKGVASSASGGGGGTGVSAADQQATTDQITASADQQATFDQIGINADTQASLDMGQINQDTSATLAAQQASTDPFSSSSVSSDIPEYTSDYGGDPFGG